MNDDAYLRKDTFDETMKRIEAMMAASEARNAAQIAEIRGEVKELRAAVDGYGDTMAAYIEGNNRRIDALEAASSKRWTIFGILVALAGFILTVKTYWPAVMSVFGG